MKSFYDVQNFQKEVLGSLAFSQSRQAILLEEEASEFENAKTTSEAIDALVDIVYVALGTAIQMGVSATEWLSAFDVVHNANMLKSLGTTKRGGNDAEKPAGWKAPNLSVLPLGRPDNYNKKCLMMGIAAQLASASTCLRRHVGCVITDKYDRILASGYNGATAGEIAPPCSRLATDKCDCTHAEQNAISMLSSYHLDKVRFIYITTHPCQSCLNLLMACLMRPILLENKLLSIYYVEDYNKTDRYTESIEWVLRRFNNLTIERLV